MFKILWDLFVAFTRANLLGYGGGPAVIPLIQVEVVNNYKWLTVEEFGEAYALGNSLPGPIATKMAGYIGYKVAGTLGSFVALIGTVIPTAIAMVALYALFQKYRDIPQIKGLMKAVRPVVVTLLALLIVDMWPKSMGSATSYVLLVLSFVAIYFFKVHQAIAIGAAMIFGIFFVR